MTTHEILVKARNLIDREGWFRVRPYHSEGENPRCALMALVVATRGVDPSVGVEVPRTFASVNGVDLHAIPGWNNQPTRTKAEVLAAFDKAIAATAPEPMDPFPIADPAPTESVGVTG